MSEKLLKITQVKSKNGRLEKHKASLLGLGIRRIHHSAIVKDSPEIRGMIAKVYYMVIVEDI